MSSYQLSHDQLEKYHKNGFLTVKAKEHNLITGSELQKWANEIYSWPKERGKWMPYNEINEKGESQLMRTECFVDYHAGLKALLCGEELGSVMRQLAGHVSSSSCFLSFLVWRQKLFLHLQKYKSEVRRPPANM